MNDNYDVIMVKTSMPAADIANGCVVVEHIPTVADWAVHPPAVPDGPLRNINLSP